MSQKINSFSSLKSLFACLIFVLLSVMTTNAQVNHLVISQVYGGGGNTGAPYKNDFIEIFNPTNSSVSLTGYSLQQASATGTSWTVGNLSGVSIGAGKYCLVQCAIGTTTTLPALPTADVTASNISIGVSSGKIALCSSTTALTGSAPTSASIVDLFGWGSTASAFEGAYGPIHTNTTSVSRINGGCTDAGNNSTDFTAGTVNPRNSATAANYCTPSALSVSTIASPQTQGVAFSVTVNAVDLNGTQKNVTSNTLVTLTTNGNAGTLSGSTTGTITTGTSSVVITGVILSGSGTGVTLTATATSGMTLTIGTSNGFNVSSAAANDCAGVPGGTALPGTACNDNNACTINDEWSASCVCAGTIQDTDGDGTCDATDECDNDPNKILAGACGCGNVEVGQSCNDNNACTLNDVITSCGVCLGTPALDTDNDGTCDLTDECDNDPNKILAGACGCGNVEPTTACDDANALTSNDAINFINGSCVCAGLYPVIYYDFATAVYTTSTINNLSASSVLQGNNNGNTVLITTTSSSSGSYSGASAGGNAGAAARIGALNPAAGGSAYFEFTLDADLNYAFTMTEIVLGTRSTGTGPQSIALRSSADGYTSDLATTSVLADNFWAKKSLVLTNFTTIPGAIVTYRLYGYAGAGNAGVNTANWRIDDLNIYGYTTFTPPVSIVQFNSPTQSGSESIGTDQLSITMDIAPVSDVVVAISNLGTGSATSGSDFTFSTASLIFTPAETYPATKTVSVTITNDTEVEAIETINFGLSVTSGTATLGTSSMVYSISSDDLAQLVINEVDYDNNGSDNAEWVEIKNNGTTAVDINGYKLELVNGGATPAVVYTTLTLATTSTLLQPGGYFVVGNNATIANINLLVTPATNLIQNGATDALALKDNSNNLLDAVSYEGNTSGGYSEGAAVNTLIDAGSPNFPSGTIGRYPDGADTGNNMTDLRTLCVGTPGAANTPSTSTFYKDFDADTYGNADSTVAACEAPVGYVSNSTDCNDTSAVSNPAATEICDALDNDCNGTADNGLTFVNYYNDADGDTYGAGTATNACQSPGATYVTNNTDCNDGASAINPGAAEICDGVDNDCTGGVDNGLTFVNYYNDGDGDNFGAGTATNACQSPGATYVTNNTDCDDGASNRFPGNSEICDGVDNDCTGGVDNGLTFVNYYNDVDGDTYGAGTATNACQSPGATYVTNNTDCNDALNYVHALQNWYSDGDMDGYDFSVINTCGPLGPAFTTTPGIYGLGDCNDADASAHPGGIEICGNSIDEDCSGADLICPVSGFAAAVAVNYIGQFGIGVQTAQTVNLSTGTNTVQSPGLGLDKWFSFIATSNAMRIAVVGSLSVEDDNDLSLYETPVDASVQLIPLVAENDVHPGALGIATDGGNETLIFDQLVVGDTYYLCVRNNNNVAGMVNLTISNLLPSSTDIALYTAGTNTFSSTCQNFKVRYRPNSAGYTIHRWASSDISGIPAWSYTIPVTSTVASTVCQLGAIAPANLSGTAQTVYVTVDVLYNLKDAFGTTTPALAIGNAAASFQMASEADLNVRVTDRCPASFKLASSSIATNRSVCGTSRYVWEMTMVAPLSGMPVYVQGSVGGSRILALSTVSGLGNGQRYDVRIASKHVDGVNQTAFGTTQCVKTFGSAGMPTIEEESNIAERSDNGITAMIYPNPTQGQFVNFSIQGLDGELQLKITDAMGRAVFNSRYIIEGSMNTTLDFGQSLANGVYMVEMMQNGIMQTMRMVVSK
ncbi:MAG: hypothetical protein RLY35_858 [Bacteroidota bacterium]